MPAPPLGAALFARARGAYAVLGTVGTTALALAIGGLVVLVTGHDPLRVYQAIFDGTGLNWFFHVGSHTIRLPFSTAKVWFPWDTASVAAQSLQQTLLLATPIALTGLGVAFALRAGLFNIGGQGQYLVGAFVSIWVGSSFVHLLPLAHVLLAVGCAALAGALYAGLAGLLKATAGAHEVITTIMLNWIAVWVGSYLFGEQGPLQNASHPGIPSSRTVVAGARLPVFWGPKELQGLSIGIFVALALLVVHAVVVNRTTLGFAVRAVGSNPEAARANGIAVGRSYVLAMAISGGFAAVGGAADLLGWEFQLAPTDVQLSQVGFVGVAAALLGRNSALGIGCASLLFGALIAGTSGRQLDPSVFPPALAGNLTTIVQGLVVLFVGLDLLRVVPMLLHRRRRA